MRDWHSGVRARLKEVCTDILYVHCSNHCLNLLYLSKSRKNSRGLRLVADTFALIREQTNLFELHRKGSMRLLQMLVMASQCNRDLFVQLGGLQDFYPHWRAWNVRGTGEDLQEIACDKGLLGDVQARAGYADSQKRFEPILTSLFAAKLRYHCSMLEWIHSLLAIDTECLQSKDSAGTLIEEAAAKRDQYCLKMRERR